MVSMAQLAMSCMGSECTYGRGDLVKNRMPDQAALHAFYRRFLESPNFSAWFERQRAAAWAWQEAEWAAAAEVPYHP